MDRFTANEGVADEGLEVAATGDLDELLLGVVQRPAAVKIDKYH